MARIEKRVVTEVVVCDLCGTEVEGNDTKVVASASGYMKRENFSLDVCPTCAEGKLNLHRRGRKAGTAMAEQPAGAAGEDGNAAPVKRRPGRPRKYPLPAQATPTPPAQAVAEDRDEDWES